MSTDITIEAKPKRTAVSFDDFVRNDLDGVIRAITLVIDDDEHAAEVLQRSVASAYRQWSTIGFDNDPQHQIFADAIATVARDSNRADELYGEAAIIAFFGLGWAKEHVSAALNLSTNEVQDQLSTAEQEHDRRDRSEFPDQLQLLSKTDHVRSQLEDAPLIKLDIAGIKLTGRKATTRNRLATLVVGLATLAVAGSMIANRAASSAPTAAPAPSDTTAEATPGSGAPDRQGTGDELAGEVGNEPRAGLVREPELIATDGAGGFAGVRSPSAQNRQAVFTRSLDGEIWELASRWNLSPTATFERFERSGDEYIAWISGVPQSSESVIGTVAFSQNLIAWTVLELSIDDEAPRGLIYEPTIDDLSVSGTNVLALVTTNVEVNFAALMLSEGYTCGRTITPEEVTVNLCNDFELDVFSFSDVSRLPDRNRLFVSRDGLPFVQIAAPFGNQAAAHLTTVNGAFAMTDETGVRFAQSFDAATWQTVVAGKPPFPVRAAATNIENDVVGVGDTADDETVVFRNTGGVTTTVSLGELIGEVSPDAQAIVAAGPTRWVIYVYESANAWLLSSPDGVTWHVEQNSPLGSTPRLLVGDDEALIQWIGEGGETITQAVLLP